MEFVHPSTTIPSTPQCHPVPASSSEAPCIDARRLGLRSPSTSREAFRMFRRLGMEGQSIVSARGMDAPQRVVRPHIDGIAAYATAPRQSFPVPKKHKGLTLEGGMRAAG
jgi:hypothetical protein